MKPIQDAYGQELLALYKDPKTPEIVERDDNWLIISTFNERYFSDYNKWDKKEKEALQLVKGKVLDVGAGAGRHSLYLQKKGFDVLAIDNSPGAIKVCKLRKVKKAKLLGIEDVDKLKPQIFDTVIMLGNNLSLLASYKKGKAILKKLYKITSKDAQIIGEVRDPYDTTNQIHLNYHNRNRKRGRMAGQVRLRIRYENIVGPWFDYLLMSPKELKNISQGTGWEVKKLITTKDSNYFAVLGKSF
jgi:SAM-dependent methyltransferase